MWGSEALGLVESARVTGTSHTGAGRWKMLAKTPATSFLISLADSRLQSPSERPLPSTPVFSKEEGERAKQSRNLDPGLTFPLAGALQLLHRRVDEGLFPQSPSRHLTVLATLHLQPGLNCCSPVPGETLWKHPSSLPSSSSFSSLGRSHHPILGDPSLQWEPGATLLAVYPGCWACWLRRGFLSRMSQPHAKDRHNDNMCVWVGTL